MRWKAPPASWFREANSPAFPELEPANAAAKVRHNRMAFRTLRPPQTRSQRSGTYPELCGPEDIAPTLAKMLGFDYPCEEDSRLLLEMTR